jgi:hypothetical protein
VRFFRNLYGYESSYLNMIICDMQISIEVCGSVLEGSDSGMLQLLLLGSLTLSVHCLVFWKENVEVLDIGILQLLLLDFWVLSVLYSEEEF